MNWELFDDVRGALRECKDAFKRLARLGIRWVMDKRAAAQRR